MLCNDVQSEEIGSVSINNPEFEGITLEEDPVVEEYEEEDDQVREEQQQQPDAAGGDATAAAEGSGAAAGVEAAAEATGEEEGGTAQQAAAEGSTGSAGAAGDDDDDGFVKASGMHAMGQAGKPFWGVSRAKVVCLDWHWAARVAWVSTLSNSAPGADTAGSSMHTYEQGLLLLVLRFSVLPHCSCTFRSRVTFEQSRP